MTTMVGPALCQPLPDHVRRRRLSRLLRFYKNHFIRRRAGHQAGADLAHHRLRRIVDEMLFCFTHGHRNRLDAARRTADGKYVGFPGRDRSLPRHKLYNEHIYWDQASVLVQIGLLDPKKLPSPASRPRRSWSTTAASNTLMARWSEIAGNNQNLSTAPAWGAVFAIGSNEWGNKHGIFAVSSFDPATRRRRSRAAVGVRFHRVLEWRKAAAGTLTIAYNVNLPSFDPTIGVSASNPTIQSIYQSVFDPYIGQAPGPLVQAGPPDQMAWSEDRSKITLDAARGDLARTARR